MLAMTNAVVVGGGSGIGAAVAAAQRAAGHDVLVWDVDGERDLTCDVTDPVQIDAAVAATVEQLGPPDHVTVTAGIAHHGWLTDVAADDWDRIVGVNAKGVWLALRALAPSMVERGGSMIAISSVSGRVADRTMGIYCASKAALDMVVRVAAMEWAPTIRVNAVAPGVTDTRMLDPAPRDRGWLVEVAARTPLGRLGAPADVASVVVALHDLEWMTGQVVECDGGLTRVSPINPTSGRPHPPMSA
jgi:NAD(P)-dependent dehydrogenase (short-subunit alcohol dehydrogenase family)